MPGSLRALAALACGAFALASSAEERPAVLGSGRVVLVPLNLGLRAAPELRPGLEPVWQQLLRQLASAEQPLVALDRASAGTLWNEVVAGLGPDAPGGVHAAYAAFARRVAEQTEFEHIVFPSLVTRAARLQGDTASWDGVRRGVASPVLHQERIDLLHAGDIEIARRGLSGELAASSLHVAVVAPDGSLRFEGAGGLVLLQKVARPQDPEELELSVALREDAFADASELREGIGIAFRKALPAARER